MASEDPYRVLGLSEDATPDEIRSAFRRLARQYHPDVGAGTSDQMAALNRAYALLSDPARRRSYDASRRGQTPIPPPPARRRPSTTPDDARPWEADLDTHADDWRQMYREERQLWEQLLAGSRPDDPGRAGLEAALAKAKRDQLELENALRARAGLPPLGPEAFEQQRRQEASIAAAHAHAGCAGSALALLAVLLVSALVLAR